MWRRCDGPLHVSGGFWLLLGWFLYANGWRLLLTVLAAAGLHECGHYAVLRLLGTRVVSMRVGVFGAEMKASGALSYAGELAAVLAGPAANLLWGVALASLGKTWFEAAGAHLVLCAFNLLPVRPLDGGRALELAVSWAAGPSAGDRTARWVGVAVSLAMAGGLTWLAWRSGSLWLLPAAAGSAKIAISELAPAKKVK